MTLVEIEQELQALGPEVAADAAAETADERAERQQIAAARQAIEEQRNNRRGRPRRRWRAWITRSRRCRPPSTSDR
jgi:hypothetical protein